MKEAWEKTLMHEAPMSHKRVETGEAMKPSGTETHSSAVYSCEVLKEPNGVTRPWPPSLLMPMNPAMTRTMTNKSSRLVSRV